MAGRWSELELHNLSNALVVAGARIQAPNVSLSKDLVPRGAMVTSSGALVAYNSHGIPPAPTLSNLTAAHHGLVLRRRLAAALPPLVVVNHTPIVINRDTYGRVHNTHNDMFRVANNLRPLVQQQLQQQKLQQQLEARVEHRQRLRTTAIIKSATEKQQKKTKKANVGSITITDRVRSVWWKMRLRDAWYKYGGAYGPSYGGIGHSGLFNTLAERRTGMQAYWWTKWNSSNHRSSTTTTSMTPKLQTLTFTNASSSSSSKGSLPKGVILLQPKPVVQSAPTLNTSSYLTDFAWSTSAHPASSFAGSYPTNPLDDRFEAEKLILARKLAGVFSTGRTIYRDIVTLRNPPLREDGRTVPTSEERWPKHKYARFGGLSYGPRAGGSSMNASGRSAKTSMVAVE